MAVVRLNMYLLLSLLIILMSCGLSDKKNEQPAQTGSHNVPKLVNHVEKLENWLHESSGLIHYDGKLWTINDSGGDRVIYALDIETGKTIQAIYIENGNNVDWESLAQDAGNIYICDIGNNYGRRDMLTIYKVSKDSIPSSGNASIGTEKINYRYAGRSESATPWNRSAYDCEAVFVYGDSLYIFTKDWETRTSTLYTCPTTPGSYEIHARKTYPVNGLITGADISPDSTFIMLSGYRDYVPFVWLYRDFNPADYSHGESIRFDYPDFTDLQTEGIAIASPERVFISCEMTQYPAALYRLDLAAAIK